MTKKYKQYLENLSKKFEKIKEIQEKPFFDSDTDIYSGNPKLVDPLVIVRKFIMDKGLKIYGGLALNEHLKKHKNPIYDKHEFPDYDVYSPDAWNHAKELCDIYYKLGFSMVEARSSILNDNHHQTYKVSIDTIYILDLTQSGCTREKIGEKDCSKCGESYNKKCISIFNNMPCNDLLNYNKKNPEVFRKTYDYNNNKSYYPNKLFVCNDDWLKISMFRELTEPLSNPSRLPKVASRLQLFEKYFSYDHSKCDVNENYDKIVKDEFKPILEYIASFIKINKLINYGASAYNFFIKNNKNKFNNLNISDYEVYIFDETIHKTLLEKLKKKYPDFNFKIQDNYTYWKEIDIDNFIILGKKKNSRKYNNLITMTVATECMPYVQYNNIRYATIDRLKYLYYRAVSLNSIINKLEKNPYNYECMLSNLIKLQKEYNKKDKYSKKGKFRRFVSKCEKGDSAAIPKLRDNLIGRYYSKLRLLEKTKYKFNYPKKGLVSKIYPLSEEDMFMPYKPEEEVIKKRIKKDYDKSKKSKKSKKIKYNYNNIL